MTEQPQERLVGWVGSNHSGPGGPWPQAMGCYQKVLGREGHNSGPHFAKMTSGQDEQVWKLESQLGTG